MSLASKRPRPMLPPAGWRLTRIDTCVRSSSSVSPTEDGCHHTARSISATHNTWSGVLWHQGQFYSTRIYDIAYIVDRVGGGDSYVAGLIYGMLTYGDPQKALDFAVAASCLKHPSPATLLMLRLPKSKKLMLGDASGRVAR